MSKNQKVKFRIIPEKLMKDFYEFSSNDLLLAYTMGIFPMANNSTDTSVTWVRPERRGIIPLNNLHISKSLKRKINSNKYSSSFNCNFVEVLNHCKNRKRIRGKKRKPLTGCLH